MDVFICGQKPGIKVQLEIPEHILEAYKTKSKESKDKYTAKQIMENMLINWINGVASK